MTAFCACHLRHIANLIIVLIDSVPYYYRTRPSESVDSYSAVRYHPVADQASHMICQDVHVRTHA